MPAKPKGRHDNVVQMKRARSLTSAALARLALHQALDAAGTCNPWARGTTSAAMGQVSLVGAGPGDPELLTLRAVRVLMRADVVVYDHLVNESILSLTADGTELIYAGKQTSHHTLSQDEICKLLVGLARHGKRVVRLKGGDPFIFGRGGEEVEFLFEHGVPFEVVPGITAASGAASYAGIPLTHRDHAQSCVFVTGHLKPGGGDIDWDNLARPRQTLVIYMGLGQIADICSNLVSHGLGEYTPAAVIEHATTPQQRVVIGNLSDLPLRVRQGNFKSPSLIIVGDVVQLHATLGVSREQNLADGRTHRAEAALS